LLVGGAGILDVGFTGNLVLDIGLVLLSFCAFGLEWWIYTKLYPPQPRNML